MAKLCECETQLDAGTDDKVRTDVGRFVGDLTHFEARTTTLIEVGEAWRCRRLAHETEEQFAGRVILHLQTLAIALEVDLATVRAMRRE